MFPRRLVVPADIPLEDLHDVLQAVMGWLDDHLHLFHRRAGEFGVPDPDFEGDAQDERTKRLHQLVEVGAEFGYSYDFGDGWEHVVVVEAAVDRDAHSRLPIRLEGARRCPPEDVGGPWGYADSLDAYSNPRNKRREMTVRDSGTRR